MSKSIIKIICSLFVICVFTLISSNTSFAYVTPEEATIDNFNGWTTGEEWKAASSPNAISGQNVFVANDQRTAYFQDYGAIVSYRIIPNNHFGLTGDVKSLVKCPYYWFDTPELAMKLYKKGFKKSFTKNFGEYIWPLTNGGSFHVLIEMNPMNPDMVEFVAFGIFDNMDHTLYEINQYIRISTLNINHK